MKKLSLLFALLCVGMMGWATTYDGTSIECTAGGYPVALTCCHTGGNYYKIDIVATTGVTILEINGTNVEVTKSSALGPISFNFSDGHVISTFESSNTPTKTSGANFIALNIKDAGEKQYNLPLDIDFSVDCSGGSEPEPEPTVTAASCRTLCNGYEYTFSNTNTGAVTLEVVLDEALSGYSPAPQVYNKSNQSTTGSTSDGKVFTFSLGNFSEAAELEYRTYFPYTAAVYERQWLTYTVGESCTDRDLAKPSITAASLVSKTSAQAVISITATDNVGVTECAVYDGTALLGNYVLADGKITVTELMYNHAYTFTIKAKDAAGNVSDNSVNVDVTTDDNTSIIDDSEAVAKDNWATESGTSATATSGTATNAIDGNGGTRWESASSDPQVWTLDLGAERVFDKIQFVWEGAYGKTFTLAISDDNSTWTTVYYVKGQALAGFPYTQTIDLPQLKARYIRFKGIERGTNYGYSFWEFRVIKSESPVLTTITASIVNDKHYYAVGTDAATLSLAFKDQYDQDIAHGAVTYNISPDASYGTISEGVFTPTKAGHISITAQVGSVVSNAVSFWATSSTNLAYNKLHSASTGEAVIDSKPAANAVDNNEGTEWQSHADTSDDEAARTYDAWLIVNLGDKYDIDLVAVKFEGACSQAYTIEFADDLEHEWKTGASYIGSAGIDAHRDEHSVLTNNTGVQYVRLFSTKAATQWGMKVQELRVFGTAAAAPTRSVSATPNNPTMGTATVKQNNADVTVVETGSEVTFNAVANDGYIFVNWSNGEENATFNTTVDANMNLTANFRALGNIYCNTPVHSSNGEQEHDAYVVMKRSNENEYKLIVRSSEELDNFGGTNFYKPNNTHVIDIRNQGVLSEDKHTLTVTFSCDKEPYMTTPLYVVLQGNFEAHFPQLTNIEYDVPCDDDVATTGIALSQTSANLLMGATMTLTPSFTPAYTSDKALTWTTSDPSTATVDGGVVTPVAPGVVTITAKLTSDNSIYATCEVTVVDALLPATWYGYSVIKPQEGVTGYTYTITRNANQTLTFTMTTDKNIVGYVSGIAGDVTGSFTGYTAETHSGSFTTTATYTDNTLLNLRLTFASANYGAPDLHIAYYVGSSNDALPQAVAVDETKDNDAILTAYDGQTVIGIVARTFPNTDEWYTLCLPFDLSDAQLTEVFGAGYTLAEMVGAEDRGSLLHLNFDYIHSFVAGKAYLLRPGTSVTSAPTFNGVTIKNVNPATLKSTNTYMEFQGTFESILLDNDNQRFVGPENYLYSPAVNGTTMKAFRCYFTIPNSSPLAGAPGKRAKIVFGPQTTTDIENVQDNVQCTKVLRDGQLYIIRDGRTYDAQGQLIK